MPSTHKFFLASVLISLAFTANAGDKKQGLISKTIEIVLTRYAQDLTSGSLNLLKRRVCQDPALRESIVATATDKMIRAHVTKLDHAALRPVIEEKLTYSIDCGGMAQQ